MIHIRGCWRVPEKRADVRVSENNRARALADLTSTKLEKKFADEFVERHN